MWNVFFIYLFIYKIYFDISQLRLRENIYVQHTDHGRPHHKHSCRITLFLGFHNFVKISKLFYYFPKKVSYFSIIWTHFYFKWNKKSLSFKVVSDQWFWIQKRSPEMRFEEEYYVFFCENIGSHNLYSLQLHSVIFPWKSLKDFRFLFQLQTWRKISDTNTDYIIFVAI